MSTSESTLAVSMGDPAGIGPEIIVKAWAQEPAAMAHCCVAGDLAVMQRAVQICQSRLPAPMANRVPQAVAVTTWQNARSLGANCIPVLQACEPASALPALRIPPL